jgi:hypothetical protein
MTSQQHQAPTGRQGPSSPAGTPAQLRPAQALAVLWSEAWKAGETEVPAGQFAIVPIGFVDFFADEAGRAA